jgi:hypothetical protein
MPIEKLSSDLDRLVSSSQGVKELATGVRMAGSDRRSDGNAGVI